MTRIRPQLYKGVFDLAPEEAAARQSMVDTVRAVYESYGYQPLATPALERQDILSGEVGEETRKEIFGWSDPEDTPVGLRFDLTVSLARFFAMHQQELPRPFRRYQIGSCWRQDKPDMAFGRFREFLQFDIDSVGSATVLTDAELLAAQVEALRAMAVPGFVVRVSSRKVLSALIAYAGIPPEREAEVLRVIDKLDKVGRANVEAELAGGRVDISGDPIKGLALDAEPIRRIAAFLDLAARPFSREEMLAEAGRLLGAATGAAEGLAELGEMAQAFAVLRLAEEELRFDLSIARGLAYYTGPVFETHLRDLPRFGAIAAGGRYDRLVERYGGQNVPSTGVSIGIDRLLAALRTLDRVPKCLHAAEVLVAVLTPNRRLDCMAISSELRREGLRVELYVGTQKQLGKQLQYADRRTIPVVVIAGEDELNAGLVTVKEMGEALEATEEIGDHAEWRSQRFGQRTVSRAELLPTVREALAIYRARGAS